MARASLTNGSQHLLDPAIVEDLAAEIVIQRHGSGIEDRPRAFHGFTVATVALIQPALENLAQAYRQACLGPCGRDVAQRFLENLLDAET